MGNVSVLKNVTLTQLLEEAPVRWPNLWRAEETRMTCLVMIPRKLRPDMEHHGFFVEHIHPIFALYYRPRDEAPTIKQFGFDPLSTSFQFLNLAVSDLGLWMKKLTEELGYQLDKVNIEPLPASASASLRLGFEAYEITTYRHDSLSSLPRLPLSMPPLSLVSKAYLSIPDTPPPAHTAVSEPEAEHEPTLDDIVDEERTEILTEIEIPAQEQVQAEPVQSAPIVEQESQPVVDPKAEELPGEVITEPAVIETIQNVIVDEGEIPNSAPVPSPPVVHAIVDEQTDLPGENVEAEFRIIVQRLMGEGLDHGTIMEDAEFQEISDRAQAAGVNTWQLFLKIAT